MASLTWRSGPITEFWPVVSGQKWSCRCLTHKNLPLQSYSLSHQLGDWWGFKEPGRGKAIGVRGLGSLNDRVEGNSVKNAAIGFCYKQEIHFYDVKLLRNRDLSITAASGTGTPRQYSCLENPMGGGAWWAAVHGVANSQTRLSDFTFTFHFHALEKEMATHSSVLAWRIPGMGKPGGLPSMRSHRVGHDWSDLAAAVLP